MLNPDGRSGTAVRIKEELDELNVHYGARDTGTGLVEIYCPLILSDETCIYDFCINLDISKYPGPPLFSANFDESQEKHPEINEYIKKFNDDMLDTWDPQNPSNIKTLVDIFFDGSRKISSFDCNGMSFQGLTPNLIFQIQGLNPEYNVYPDKNDSKKYRVTFYSALNYQEYSLVFDFHDFPPLNVKPLDDLALIIQYPERMDFIKNFDPQIQTLTGIMDLIMWEVEKHFRLELEEQIIENEELPIDAPKLVNIKRDPIRKRLNVSLKGILRSKELVFDFEFKFHEKYPTEPPEIQLMTKAEDIDENEQMIQQINDSIEDFKKQWHQYSFVIDLIHEIRKKIYNISISNCIICHRFKCPECKNGLIEYGEEKQLCVHQCPNCHRFFHEHCWKPLFDQYKRCPVCNV